MGLFDESLQACEDYDMWLKITARNPVLYIKDSLIKKYGGHNDQLSKKYWGQGIIPEAVRAVFRYGFMDMKLEKIFAQTDLLNLPSQSVMKKMNMQQEALLKKHIISQNTRRDVVYYSILKSDWEKQVN